MSDILKEVREAEVIFSPSTEGADLWMRETFALNDNIKVAFELPTERDQAMEFEKSATEAGFKISNF